MVKQSENKKRYDMAYHKENSVIKNIRFGKLMRAVMRCLISESDDPVTEGFLLERDVYRSLRDNTELGTLPTIEEISNMTYKEFQEKIVGRRLGE